MSKEEEELLIKKNGVGFDYLTLSSHLNLVRTETETDPERERERESVRGRRRR